MRRDGTSGDPCGAFYLTNLARPSDSQILLHGSGGPGPWQDAGVPQGPGGSAPLSGVVIIDDVKRLALAAALFVAACSKNIQNPDAVKQAIIDYLNAKSAQTGLNMANITVDVTALEFERDSARATVSFRAKGTDQATGMNMNYTLDRKGDHWTVRERVDSGSNPHGGAMPQTAPPSGADQGGGMPAGHPPVSGGAPGGTLPPGHPGVGAQHGGGGNAGSQQ